MERVNTDSNQHNGKLKTLLVVDDDPDLRALEVRLLAGNGYHILEAECVAKAMEVARANPAIDLLLTDFQMPAGDGLDLTRQFRALYPGVPVLLVSGTLYLFEQKLRNAPQCEILEKPFAVDVLLRTVEKLLREVTPLPNRNGAMKDLSSL